MVSFSKPLRLPDLARAQQRPLVLAALVLVLLRSRLGSLGKETVQAVASKIKGKEPTKKLSPEENLQVLQKIFEENENGKVLLVPYRDRVTKVHFAHCPDKRHSDSE